MAYRQLALGCDCPDGSAVCGVGYAAISKGAILMLKRIVEQCKDCCLPDFSEGYCTAFDDPEYQWRNGECWGRCNTAEEMIRRLQAIISYNELHGLNTASVAKLKREMEGWQETARVLRGGEIA